MNRTLYATLIAFRDEAWDARDIEPESGDPSSEGEWFWYHQGRAEAYAQVMTLLERSETPV